MLRGNAFLADEEHLYENKPFYPTEIPDLNLYNDIIMRCFEFVYVKNIDDNFVISGACMRSLVKDCLEIVCMVLNEAQEAEKWILINWDWRLKATNEIVQSQLECGIEENDYTCEDIVNALCGKRYRIFTTSKNDELTLGDKCVLSKLGISRMFDNTSQNSRVYNNYLKIASDAQEPATRGYAMRIINKK